MHKGQRELALQQGGEVEKGSVALSALWHTEGTQLKFLLKAIKIKMVISECISCNCYSLICSLMMCL